MNLILVIVLYLAVGMIFCRIAGKMGFSAPMGLTMLVPFLNIAVILLVAFSRWPIENECAWLRAELEAARANAARPLPPE